MKGKKIILIVLLLIVVVALSFTGALLYSKAMPKEKKVDTIIYSVGSKFQTNLKESRSIISLNLQLEVEEDKKLLASLEERNPELRSRILDIIRDKTVEDVAGTAGKRMLEQEILSCLRSIFGKDKIIDAFIDDIVVQ